eukprot:5852299-Lingulodinium_polyedra.AAC.1
MVDNAIRYVNVSANHGSERHRSRAERPSNKVDAVLGTAIADPRMPWQVVMHALEGLREQHLQLNAQLGKIGASKVCGVSLMLANQLRVRLNSLMAITAPRCMLARTPNPAIR